MSLPTINMGIVVTEEARSDPAALDAIVEAINANDYLRLPEIVADDDPIWDITFQSRLTEEETKRVLSRFDTIVTCSQIR